jgi:hypothetical protein
LSDDILVVLNRLTPVQRRYAADALRSEAKLIRYHIGTGRRPLAQREVGKAMEELADAVERYVRL